MEKKRKREAVDLNSLTVNILKEVLKKKKLNANGRKAELIERIKENISEGDIEEFVDDILNEDSESSSQDDYSADGVIEADEEEGDSSVIEDINSQEIDEMENLDEKTLNKLSYPELRDLAKKRGLKGSKKKEDIIKMVLKNQEERQELMKLRLKDVTTDVIAKIPEVVFKNHILIYCDVQSILNISQTCRPFYRMTNSNFFWKKFVERKFEEAEPLKNKHKTYYKEYFNDRGSLPYLCEEKVRYIRENNKNMCTRCDKFFVELENHNKACKFHREDFTYENRWSREDMHWKCCDDGDEEAEGCCQAKHTTSDNIDKKGVVNYDYYW